MGNLIFPLVHIFSVLTFSYTGDIIALYPAIAHICFIIFVHVFGLGAILSPGYRKRWAEKYDGGVPDVGMSTLMQLSMLLSAYQIYTVGFAILAGMSMLHSFTVLVSVGLTKLNITGDE